MVFMCVLYFLKYLPFLLCVLNKNKCVFLTTFIGRSNHSLRAPNYPNFQIWCRQRAMRCIKWWRGCPAGVPLDKGTFVSLSWDCIEATLALEGWVVTGKLGCHQISSLHRFCFLMILYSTKPSVSWCSQNFAASPFVYIHIVGSLVELAGPCLPNSISGWVGGRASPTLFSACPLVAVALLLLLLLLPCVLVQPCYCFQASYPTY